MRDFKIKMRKHRSWIAERFLRAAVPVRRVFKTFTESRAFLSVRSAFRKMESLAAHGSGMPVEEFDARRRAFMKYAFFGGVVLVIGKYIDPIVNTIRGDTILSEKTFENFKITETGKQLRVTDDDGEEILTIDKESF